MVVMQVSVPSELGHPSFASLCSRACAAVSQGAQRGPSRGAVGWWDRVLKKALRAL